MKVLLRLFITYKVYFLITFLFILFGLLALLFLKHGESVIAVNQCHNSYLDIFFTFITRLGEITGYLMSVLILVFISVDLRKKYFLTLTMSALLSLGITQSCKHYLFKNDHRPSYFYDNLHAIENENQHKNNSFPSGHTTAAFTFATVIAFSCRKIWVQITTPILALLVAYSRLYLGQHFLIDIVVGGILGLMIASICFYLINDWFSSPK